MKLTRDGRTRNFATIIYEESAPINWQSILAEQFIPCFISPYHDKDINPTGEPKKPHWHVVIMFDSVKTLEQAKAVFQLIQGVGCEIVQSIRGYARYLCHLDNPEKAQYEPSNVRSLCGADYISTIGLVTDKYNAICEIMDFCDKYNISSYQKLLQFCRNVRYDWFRVLCDSATFVVTNYLKSKKADNIEENNIHSSSSMPVNWWDNDVTSFESIEKKSTNDR